MLIHSKCIILRLYHYYVKINLLILIFKKSILSYGYVTSVTVLKSLSLQKGNNMLNYFFITPLMEFLNFVSYLGLILEYIFLTWFPPIDNQLTQQLFCWISHWIHHSFVITSSFIPVLYILESVPMIFLFY